MLRPLTTGAAQEVSLIQDKSRTIPAAHRVKGTRQARLNAFVTITEDLAFAQARRADEELARGIDRGPLHGIPYALKDNFATRGIRTTCGSKIFVDRIPDRDSAVYKKLTEAGAVLMGKDSVCTNLLTGSRATTPILERSAIHTIPAEYPEGRAAGLRRGRGGPGFLRHGHRHRRVDSRPGLLLRMRRFQAGLRTREQLRCFSTRIFSRPRGSADSYGSRCRYRNECHRRSAASGKPGPPNRRSRELLQ